MRPSVTVLEWVRYEKQETEEDLMRILHCTGVISVQINSHAIARGFKQYNNLGGCLQFVGKEKCYYSSFLNSVFPSQSSFFQENGAKYFIWEAFSGLILSRPKL